MFGSNRHPLETKLDANPDLRGIYTNAEIARGARADPARGFRSELFLMNCVVLFTPPRARSASAAGPRRAPAEISHGAILLRDPQE